MKKTSLESPLKIRKIIPVLIFCAFFSMIGGIIFAQTAPSSSTNLIYYTVTSSSVPLEWENDPTIVWGVTFEETDPSSPANLTYYTVTSSSVPIASEGNLINGGKFNIERKLTAATDWTGAWHIQITTASTTNYTDTSIIADASYDYRVQACLPEIDCSDWAYLDEVILSDIIAPPQESTTITKQPIKTSETSVTTTTKPTPLLPISPQNAPAIPAPTPPTTAPIISTVVFPAAPPATPESTAAAPAPATTAFSSKTQDLGLIIEKLQITESDVKEQLSKVEGGDLLYKDSNKDGISDYDSVYVYNLNPAKPSPISVYEGKTVNASQKILLGFDPTKSEIVEVNKEQPVASPSPIVSTYKVKEVALTQKKEIILKGQALPNSFVTVYIYSTPIIVTVKTDSQGGWQYVLNKELENGDHTIYTATVNNSGNIVAKSNGYLFTKTAAAVTLKNLPSTVSANSANTNKPGFFGGNNLYVVLLVAALAVIIVLVLIGITSKRKQK